MGELDSGLACYCRALNIKPYLAEAKVAESTALCSVGTTVPAGGFEMRWQTRDYDAPLRTYPQPIWTGEVMISGRVLIGESRVWVAM